MWTADIEHPPKTVFEDRPAFMLLKAIHDSLKPTPLFRMGTWLVAYACCFARWRGAAHHRRRAPSRSPSAARQLFYVLSYLPLGVASEFRYVYWAVLASAAGRWSF